MIAKGNTHNNGAKLAVYMKDLGKDNQRTEVHQLRGLAEDEIVDAFRTIQGIAAGTHCEQPFFHCQVRTPTGEDLTREQWEFVADRIESKLGLTGQPRAITFHLKGGHEHMHVAWSRIDTESMTAKPLPFFKLRLKEVCRELESELGLTPVRNRREKGELLPPTREEYEQARRLGIDAKAVRVDIREAWDRSDGGKSFAAALSEKGLTLAKGERRDFVVIDAEGGMHALGKRILGISAVQTRERMADIDRSSLPTVEQARQEIERNTPAHLVEPTPAPSIPKSVAPEPQLFDRDAADREWQERVNDAGIAKDKAGREATGDAMKQLRKAARADNATLQEQGNEKFWKDYREKKDVATEQRTERWEKYAAAERKRSEPLLSQTSVKSGLTVTKGVGGAISKLADFLCDLLAGPSAPPRSQDQDQVERVIAQRRAAAALDRIRQSMARGESLGAADIRSLTRDQLINIRDKGDDALRRMIEQTDRDRQRERDGGRTRER